MTWSRGMRRGAWITAAGTGLMIVLTLGYLWNLTQGWDGVTPWAFLKMGVVIAVVWMAIGATMGFFIVMIIQKNEGRS